MDPVSILTLIGVCLGIGKTIFDFGIESRERIIAKRNREEERMYRRAAQQQLMELHDGVSQIMRAQMTQFHHLCACLEQLDRKVTAVQQVQVCGTVFVVELAVYIFLSQHFTPEMCLYKDLIRLLFFAVSSCYVAFGSRWTKWCSYVLCLISLYFSVTRPCLVAMASYSTPMFIGCLILAHATPRLVKKHGLSLGSAPVIACSRFSWAACFTLSLFRLGLSCWPEHVATAIEPALPSIPHLWEVLVAACHMGFSLWCSLLEPMAIAYRDVHDCETMLFVLLQVIGICLPAISTWPARSMYAVFAQLSLARLLGKVLSNCDGLMFVFEAIVLYHVKPSRAAGYPVYSYSYAVSITRCKVLLRRYCPIIFATMIGLWHVMVSPSSPGVLLCCQLLWRSLALAGWLLLLCYKVYTAVNTVHPPNNWLQLSQVLVCLAALPFAGCCLVQLIGQGATVTTWDTNAYAEMPVAVSYMPV